MIWFWRYLFGYLTIKIDGENSEQFINLSSSCGIYIWNLYLRGGSIFGNISRKNFLKLFAIRHKKKCKIQIVKKYGIINKIQKYKNRFGFYIGIIVFFTTLYFLTNFIWIINFNGNSNIPVKNITSVCNQLGIKEGVLKSKINSKYDAQRLQLSQNEIAWCSFNIEGCVLNINLSETPITEKEIRQNPCNIKASVDGIITKIDITSGNINVKVGDIVSKGDLLVSGITQNANSTVFVHSSGEIIAETKREFSAVGNFEQTITEETGIIDNRRSIEFFGIKIPLFLGNINQPHIYKNETKTVKLLGNKIPIKISNEKFIFTTKKKVEYSQDALEKMLADNIKKQINNFDFIDIEEIDKEIITTDKGILLKLTYKCTENIAKQDEILLSKVN